MCPLRMEEEEVIGAGICFVLPLSHSMEWPAGGRVNTPCCVGATASGSQNGVEIDTNLHCSLINSLLEDDEEKQQYPGEEASTNSDCLSAGKWPDMGSEKTGASTPGSASEVSFFMGSRPGTATINTDSSVNLYQSPREEDKYSTPLSCLRTTSPVENLPGRTPFLRNPVPVPPVVGNQPVDVALGTPHAAAETNSSDALSNLSSSLFSLVTAPGGGASSPRDAQLALPSLAFPPSQIVTSGSPDLDESRRITDSLLDGEKRGERHFQGTVPPSPAGGNFTRAVESFIWHDVWRTEDKVTLDTVCQTTDSDGCGAIWNEPEHPDQSVEKQGFAPDLERSKDPLKTPIFPGLIGPAAGSTPGHGGHLETIDTPHVPSGEPGAGKTRADVELDTACLLLAALQPTHSLPPSHASQTSTACCTSVPSSPSKRAEACGILNGSGGWEHEWPSPSSRSSGSCRGQLFPCYSETVPEIAGCKREAEPGGKEERTPTEFTGSGNCGTRERRLRCSADEVERGRFNGETDVACELQCLEVFNPSTVPKGSPISVGECLRFARVTGRTVGDVHEYNHLDAESGDRAADTGPWTHGRSVFSLARAQPTYPSRGIILNTVNSTDFHFPPENALHCGTATCASATAGEGAIRSGPVGLSDWRGTVGASGLSALRQGPNHERTLQSEGPVASAFPRGPGAAGSLTFDTSFQSADGPSQRPPQLPSSRCRGPAYVGPPFRSAIETVNLEPPQEGMSARSHFTQQGDCWNSSSRMMHRDRAPLKFHDQPRVREGASFPVSGWRPDTSLLVPNIEHTDGQAAAWPPDSRNVKPERPKFSGGGPPAPVRGRLTLQEVLDSPSDVCSLKFPACETRRGGSSSWKIESPMAATLGKLLAAYSGPCPASQSRPGCSMKPDKQSCLNDEHLVRQGSYVVGGPEQTNRRGANVQNTTYGWGKKAHQHQAGVTVAGQHRAQGRQPQGKAIDGVVSSLSFGSVPQADLQSASAAGVRKDCQSHSRSRGKN
ncbi:hypothetical protein CSUI_005678 [Cystoisospora suis]|uniref:Uncharacterized protein n=1 Tax=Cystoisospora suis TaxID=483139 RepID=A0A2C6KX37_9APIC|nr:hypothetical protein CSUI_005678 [Cystoisospora suis]